MKSGECSDLREDVAGREIGVSMMHRGGGFGNLECLIQNSENRKLLKFKAEPNEMLNLVPEADYLFNWIVNYHITRNLPLYSSVIERKENIEESEVGFDDAAPNRCKRFMIAGDGETIRSLHKLGIVLDQDQPSFKSVEDYNLFASYFDKIRGDGVYIMDLEEKELAKIRLMRNGIPLQEYQTIEQVLEILPKKVLTKDESRSLEEMGTKGKLAAALVWGDYGTKGHQIATYQLKGTVHSKEVGAGVVIKMTRERIDLFYFDQDCSYQGSFIDLKHKVFGVYEQYKFNNEEKKFVLESTRIVGVETL